MKNNNKFIICPNTILFGRIINYIVDYYIVDYMFIPGIKAREGWHVQPGTKKVLKLLNSKIIATENVDEYLKVVDAHAQIERW